MENPKKVVVIGLDCALPHLIEKHIADGKLPTFKKLIESGTLAENGLAPFPTVTPPNWATIATGAWAGTHGITDFHVPRRGETPSNYTVEQAFSSKRCQAEFLWDTADKAGKKCIVLNYPGSWPSSMKHGIMVGGAGLAIGEFRDGLPALEAKMMLCHDQLISTGAYPRAIRGKFVPAQDWQNLVDAGPDPLEMTAPLAFTSALEPPAPTTWFVLLRQSNGQGYDTITLAPSKNFAEAFCTLKVGQWSSKIITTITMQDGSQREVFFRCKAVELSPEAEDFRLFISALCATTGWSNPPEIAKELVSAEGTFAPGGGVRGFAIDWYDTDTYVEINDQNAQWLADAATTLLTKHPWDLFFMHSHPPDWVYHVLMTDMDPALCPDEARRQRAWDAHLKIYESQDRMIAQILGAVDKDTLVILVSDHGATPDGPTFDPYNALIPAGLTVMSDQRADLGIGLSAKLLKAAARIPLPISKAFAQREIHIYVNLKGRDPEGVIEPEDYEKVQQEIVDALLTYVDPATGKRPVSLALTKRDARILGLYGDMVGDVIYAVNPWFGSQHGYILPAAEWGVGSLKTLLLFNGPGIKKGHRLKRNAWLTDIVPTICYLLDLPLPEHAEGAVLYQMFRDPNFKTKDIQKLKDGLARMEVALARQTREPWDKHDCA